jgi:hypothetical protein
MFNYVPCTYEETVNSRILEDIFWRKLPVQFHKFVKMNQNRFHSLLVVDHSTYTAPSRPTPRDQHELTSSLGLWTCYRWFIVGYADIANALIKLKEGKRTFQRSPRARATFRPPKEALCTAPVISYRQPAKTFTIDTHAANVGISVVVSQVQDGQERVMAYYSKTLTTADRSYCITQRNLLAVVTTLKQASLWTGIPPTHWPTVLTIQLQESRRSENPLRPASRNPTSRPITVRVRRTTMPMLARRPHRDQCTHCQKVEGSVRGQKVEATAVVPADDRDCAALKTE